MKTVYVSENELVSCFYLDMDGSKPDMHRFLKEYHLLSAKDYKYLEGDLFKERFHTTLSEYCTTCIDQLSVEVKQGVPVFDPNTWDYLYKLKPGVYRWKSQTSLLSPTISNSGPGPIVVEIDAFPIRLDVHMALTEVDVVGVGVLFSFAYLAWVKPDSETSPLDISPHKRYGLRFGVDAHTFWAPTVDEEHKRVYLQAPGSFAGDYSDTDVNLSSRLDTYPGLITSLNSAKGQLLMGVTRRPESFDIKELSVLDMPFPDPEGYGKGSSIDNFMINPTLPSSYVDRYVERKWGKAEH